MREGKLFCGLPFEDFVDLLEAVNHLVAEIPVSVECVEFGKHLVFCALLSVIVRRVQLPNARRGQRIKEIEKRSVTVLAQHR